MGSGKSSLIQALVTDAPPPIRSYNMTSDAQVYLKHVQVGTGSSTEGAMNVEFYIFDIAGHEIYRDLLTKFAKGSQWVVCTLDLTDSSALKKLERWIEIAKQIITTSSTETKGQQQINIVVFGTKSDVERPRRCIESKEVEDLLQPLGIKYFEVSSQKVQSVLEAFQFMAATTK